MTSVGISTEPLCGHNGSSEMEEESADSQLFPMSFIINAHKSQEELWVQCGNFSTPPPFFFWMEIYLLVLCYIYTKTNRLPAHLSGEALSKQWQGDQQPEPKKLVHNIAMEMRFFVIFHLYSFLSQ